MELKKQNEKVIESRQSDGVSFVVREVEYAKIDDSGEVKGYLTLFEVSQDLPTRKDFESFVDKRLAVDNLDLRWSFRIGTKR
jgi:hypothetical protein